MRLRPNRGFALGLARQRHPKILARIIWEFHATRTSARSYRTLGDGSFEGRFPRHFVPGYDRTVTPGQVAVPRVETLG
jgi:hypothetical protein